MTWDYEKVTDGTVPKSGYSVPESIEIYPISSPNFMNHTVEHQKDGQKYGKNSPVKLSEEVTKAKADGIPIVCLESTVFSQLGLPSPSNAEALELCMSTLKMMM